MDSLVETRVRATWCVLSTLVLFFVEVGCSSAGQGTSTAAHNGACIDLAKAPMTTVVQQDGSSTVVIEAVSGDLRVGNFGILAQSQRDPTGAIEAKLYWIPTDVEIAKTARLTVTVAERADLSRIESTQVFGGDGNWSRIPNGQYFWPTNVVLPAAGSWRLVGAVTGLARGCFDIDLR